MEECIPLCSKMCFSAFRNWILLRSILGPIIFKIHTFVHALFWQNFELVTLQNICTVLECLIGKIQNIFTVLEGFMKKE